MRYTPPKKRIPANRTSTKWPRHKEILGALIRTPDPEVAEMLTHSLIHAPRNRAQARDQIRRMTKDLRRRYGFGWDRWSPKVGIGNWVRAS